jgi:hypothetical protein
MPFQCGEYFLKLSGEQFSPVVDGCRMDSSVAAEGWRLHFFGEQTGASTDSFRPHHARRGIGTRSQQA